MASARNAALQRVAQIAGLGMRAVEMPVVPTRRVIALARYGMAAKAPKLARHPYERKLATLLATVRWLEVQATDDALELFDVFMTNELIGRAGKNADKQKLRRLPGQSKHVAVQASAVQVLFEADGWGDAVPLELVWEAIDKAVGSRARLVAAVAGVQDMIPPPTADPQGQWRAQVVERFATVRPFLRLLCEVIEFGATVDAAPVLAAIRDLPSLLDARASERVPKGFLDALKVNVDLVPKGWWQQLVFAKGRPNGTVDRNAYVFCVLELFHTALKHRDIYALVSDRWADPRARLLTGRRWQQTKGPALSALQLPERPDELLDELTVTVDGAWRAAAGGIVPDGPVSVDAEGRLHLAKDDAHDAIRVLQRDGRLNALGEAIAHYGRIFKTLHVLSLVEDPVYRRELKRMRNLQEQRHGLGRHVFHGRKGEVYRAYHDGMEDQLGALGLVLNCVTLWNTIYLDHAVATLREQGYPVRDADAARLSVYQYAHLNVHGHYSFVLPDLAGGHRPLRDPDRVPAL